MQLTIRFMRRDCSSIAAFGQYMVEPDEFERLALFICLCSEACLFHMGVEGCHTHCPQEFLLKVRPSAQRLYFLLVGNVCRCLKLLCPKILEKLYLYVFHDVFYDFDSFIL